MICDTFMADSSRSYDVHSTLTSVSDRVKDFYDRYPYPRPIDRLDKYRQLWEDTNRRRADYHLFWPSQPYREDRSILIAGCGTSQAAKYALRWPAAHVVGIDFSATSVRCTDELKRKYNLNNLQVHQLPIESVQDLKMKFDQIVCTGVLHHFQDPNAGLSVLREVLKPDGAMHLMVYAPYGRAGIYLLQEFCRRTGIQATDEGIEELIAALRFLPVGHPLERLLSEAPDFREDAAIADALLHPQDRSYSVPELFAFVERGGLTFGRWIRQASYLPQCGDIAKIPQASRITRLPLAAQYAAVELFRGTMVEHSMILYRNDNSGIPRLSFAGDSWLDYVPIRMSETICVQERLPPGAAGVLINQNHTYRDLILPIDSTEKRLFDAIDGSRTIGNIIQQTSLTSQEKSQIDRARSLFEHLWWYDQVVFQTRTYAESTPSTS